MMEMAGEDRAIVGPSDEINSFQQEQKLRTLTISVIGRRFHCFIQSGYCCRIAKILEDVDSFRIGRGFRILAETCAKPCFT
jgi:hypothetical protein